MKKIILSHRYKYIKKNKKQNKKNKKKSNW